jgi:hypothetical protein
VKFVRSWPEKVPADRNYVVDNLPKFIMKDYCYRGLGDLGDDVLLIEWDMAVHPEHLESFIDQARSNPDEVLVAPYKIYMETERDNTVDPFWCLRRYTDEREMASYFVDEGEPTCHIWGLGLTYLPRHVIDGFLSQWPGHFNDTAVSGWHYRNVQKETRIAWDVRPVHLHYPIERMV